MSVNTASSGDSPFAPTLELLRSLPSAEDFRAAITIMNDLGYATYEADRRELARLLQGVASARESLEHRYGGDAGPKNPADMLRDGVKQFEYLAGALWAASALIEARASAVRAARTRAQATSRRARLGDLILELLDKEATGTPSDILRYAEASDLSPSRSDISKALAELEQRGLVEATAPPEPAADRRRRYYTRTDASRSPDASGALAAARGLLEQAWEMLTDVVSNEEADELVTAWSAAARQ